MKYPKFMKTKGFKWFSISAIGVIILYYLLRDKVDSKVLGLTGKSEEWLNDVKTKSDSQLDKNKLLKKGSRGKEVIALQFMIKQKGGDLGDYGPDKDGLDGVFGAKTETALLSTFQVKETTLNKLIADNLLVDQGVSNDLKNPSMIYN